MSENPWDDVNFGTKKPEKKTIDTQNKEKTENDFYSSFAGLIDNILGLQNPKKNNKSIFFAVVISIVLYCFSGILTVAPEQQAIITRFGKYNRTLGPGLHYRMPYPVENTFKETVTRIRTLKIGLDSNLIEAKDTSNKSLYLVSAGNSSRLQDGLMLTGDENIIDMHFEVQWKIKDLKAYVFSIKDPIKTITDVSQSVIREIVAKNTLADIITKGRAIIESSTTENVQAILDDYNSGVEIVTVQMLRADPPLPVIDAFRDVQTARVDKESDVNRAESYRNDITPKARGQAQKIIQDAEAYSIEEITKAQGQASRFNNIYDQYKNAKYVTRKRIYLETMEDVFSGMDKIIIDDNVSKGVIPYLPLDMMHKTKTEDVAN
jgi:membrane protease subunit HflK